MFVSFKYTLLLPYLLSTFLWVSLDDLYEDTLLYNILVLHPVNIDKMQRNTGSRRTTVPARTSAGVSTSGGMATRRSVRTVTSTRATPSSTPVQSQRQAKGKRNATVDTLRRQLQEERKKAADDANAARLELQVAMDKLSAAENERDLLRADNQQRLQTPGIGRPQTPSQHPPNHIASNSQNGSPAMTNLHAGADESKTPDAPNQSDGNGNGEEENVSGVGGNVSGEQNSGDSLERNGTNVGDQRPGDHPPSPARSDE